MSLRQTDKKFKLQNYGPLLVASDHFCMFSVAVDRLGFASSRCPWGPGFAVWQRLHCGHQSDL